MQITGIDIPFGSLVAFAFKASFAFLIGGALAFAAGIMAVWTVLALLGAV